MEVKPMPETPLPEDLARFLVRAKIHTYAAGEAGGLAVAAPALQGAHQFEYREGDLLYRDIYFGEAFFAGQEVVYRGIHPIWSMCYAGGWTANLTDPADMERLGGILQAALREVPAEHPYRGPVHYTSGDYAYRNEPSGDITRFCGVERISSSSRSLYELRYCGGRLS
jgi:hypothetical protein